MTRWDAHLTDEQLAQLALTVGDHDEQEEAALAHVSSCDPCSARLAAVTVTIAGLRTAARDEADARFGDDRLERQQRRVLARVAHLGEPAKVLHFPAGTDRAPGLSARTRTRWISVAAAAGLIIGLLAGQGLHLLPARSAWQAASARRAAMEPTPQQGRFRPATVTVSDDELLGSVESALELRRGAELQALDALTPVAFEGR